MSDSFRRILVLGLCSGAIYACESAQMRSGSTADIMSSGSTGGTSTDVTGSTDATTATDAAPVTGTDASDAVDAATTATDGTDGTDEGRQLGAADSDIHKGGRRQVPTFIGGLMGVMGLVGLFAHAINRSRHQHNRRVGKLNVGKLRCEHIPCYGFFVTGYFV